MDKGNILLQILQHTGETVSWLLSLFFPGLELSWQLSLALIAILLVSLTGLGAWIKKGRYS